MAKHHFNTLMNQNTHKAKRWAWTGEVGGEAVEGSAPPVKINGKVINTEAWRRTHKNECRRLTGTPKATFADGSSALEGNPVPQGAVNSTNYVVRNNVRTSGAASAKDLACLQAHRETEQRRCQDFKNYDAPVRTTTCWDATAEDLACLSGRDKELRLIEAGGHKGELGRDLGTRMFGKTRNDKHRRNYDVDMEMCKEAALSLIADVKANQRVEDKAEVLRLCDVVMRKMVKY